MRSARTRGSSVCSRDPGIQLGSVLGGHSSLRCLVLSTTTPPSLLPSRSIKDDGCAVLYGMGWLDAEARPKGRTDGTADGQRKERMGRGLFRLLCATAGGEDSRRCRGSRHGCAPPSQVPQRSSSREDLFAEHMHFPYTCMHNKIIIPRNYTCTYSGFVCTCTQ